MYEYLSELNEQQRKAAEIISGPLLVVAGAGTGKTRTLTYRILHLIKTGISPERILAVTFTNKAAAEMKERIAKLIEPQGDDGMYAPTPCVKTFHSLGVYIMRQHASELGVNKYFTILDRQDTIAMLKRAMKNRDIDPKAWDPKRILGVISSSKGKGTGVKEFAGSEHSELTHVASEVWREYERLKTEAQSFDFDDLLLKTYELLRDHQNIREYYQNLWLHVHVDEYQDTNGIQFKIAKLLSEKHKNICVVGDGDQTIYTWRGAKMTNILHFEKDFPGGQVVILEQNYRSTKNILDAAHHVIKKNVARVDKVLFTEGIQGSKLIGYQAFHEYDEARWITRQVKEVLSPSVQLSDIAVLFRTNFQSRVLEEAFLQAGLQYTMTGVRFFERKEVKDILAYLRLAFNSSSLADIARVVNYPRRGIGKVALAHIISGDLSNLSAKALATYTNFMTMIENFREYAHEHRPSETIAHILEASGIRVDLAKGGSDDAERLENIKELVSYATKYDVLELRIDEEISAVQEGEVTRVEEVMLKDYSDHIELMLEHIALMSDQDELSRKKENIDAVKLMTIHAAKGLEFKHVFIVGLEQGLFPSDVGSDSENRDTEEERRLMYVALTRAKEQLYLSWAQVRRIFGQQRFQTPSEFLLDIPDTLIDWNMPQDSDTGEEIKTVYLDF